MSQKKKKLSLVPNGVNIVRGARVGVISWQLCKSWQLCNDV